MKNIVPITVIIIFSWLMPEKINKVATKTVIPEEIILFRPFETLNIDTLVYRVIGELKVTSSSETISVLSAGS
jgi:hypothetical protein